MAIKTMTQGGNKICLATITTAGLMNTPFITLTNVKSVDQNGDPLIGSFKIKVTLNQYDKDLRAAMSNFMAPNKIESLEIMNDDASYDTKVTGTDSATKLGVLSYDSSVENSKAITTGRAVFIPGDYGVNASGPKSARETTFGFQFIDGADFTLGASLLDTTEVVAPTADIVLSSSEFGTIIYLTSATT